MNKHELPAIPDDIAALLNQASSIPGPTETQRSAVLERVNATVGSPTLAPAPEPASSSAFTQWASAGAVVLATTAAVWLGMPASDHPLQIAAPAPAPSVATVRATPEPLPGLATRSAWIDEASATRREHTQVAVPTVSPRAAESASLEPRRPSADAVAPAISIPSERQLVLAARRQFLSGQHGRALATLKRHRALYRRGVLTQEREALFVRALAKSGRMAEARRRADAFARRFPGSIHTPIVQRAVR